jgi:PAS domain-containing protein
MDNFSVIVSPIPSGGCLNMTDDQLAVAIAETTSAMLWMGDSKGQCLFLSLALRRFWGVDPDRIETFDWSSTLHPDDVNMLAAPFGRAMADHTAGRFGVERRLAGTGRALGEADPRKPHSKPQSTVDIETRL